MTDAPAVAVRRIDHVGIAVTDLDAAAGFFAEMFGLRLDHRETNEDQGVDEAMLVSPAETAGGAQIQLLAALRPDSPVGRFLDRRGQGMQQLAFEVDDVDAASAALRERGIRVLFDAARPGTCGSRVNFIHPGDSYGVLIELVEKPGASATARDD